MKEFQKCVVNEGIHTILVPFLQNRGIKTCDELFQFLHPDINQLHSPFLMKDMEKAVSRLKRAIAHNEKILVYGDYDVDGITSTALLLRMLKKLGNSALYYIPNRIEDGYGMHIEGIKYAKEKGVNLIITVDCGIKAVEEVRYARSLGIDVIITDHHLLGDKLPPAIAILNPHSPNDNYPFKELAGVGVVFKLLQGLFDKTSQELLLWNLDLVALGTLSDAVSLYNENRIFAKFGLRILKKGKNMGIYALKEQVNMLNKKVTEENIAFKLAPRLNATGRLGKAEIGLKLLLTDDIKTGRGLAREIETMNLTRRKIQNRMTSEAIDIVRMKNEPINVVSSLDWHRGVIGIVASRLVERFNEPFIVIAMDGDTGYGSGRSVEYINIIEVLNGCEELLLKYGGHSQACGITIEKQKLQEFSRRFTQEVQKRLNNTHKSILSVDNEILLSDIDDELIHSLEVLSPFGEGFSPPVFLLRDIEICGSNPLLACKSKKRIKIDTFSIPNIPSHQNINLIGNIILNPHTNKPRFRVIGIKS